MNARGHRDEAGLYRAGRGPFAASRSAGPQRPIDGILYQGVASFRRRIIVGASLAVLLLAGISIALAWRQYDDARTRATNDLEARVVAVSAVVDTSFSGQISTLTAIAQGALGGQPGLVRDERLFRARINPSRAPLFSGGLGWIDAQGHVLGASSNPRSKRSRTSPSASTSGTSSRPASRTSAPG